MKKGLFFISLILLGAIFFWYQKGNKDDWQTFVKKENQLIKTYPTTSREKKEARIDKGAAKSSAQNSHTQAQSTKRAPASLKKGPPASKTPQNQRITIALPDQTVIKDASPLNKPHKEWKKRLGNEILRFMRPETKVYLKKLESLTVYEKGRPLHVEKVHVKLTTPEGRLFSYNALVDSETGKVVETWNQTNHEPMGGQTKKIRPSGALINDKEESIRF